MTPDDIYDILVDECGAPERQRAMFVHYLHEDQGSFGHEYRFQGKLGFGGKFHKHRDKMWVSAYQEDYTPERLAMIEAANERLK